MPFPSGALQQDPSCVVSGDRVLIDLEAENDDGELVKIRLIFDGVQVLRRTSDPAKTVAMVQTAYNKVVDRGDTPWLREVSAQPGVQRLGERLRDLIISFDDAPCYEILCSSFAVEHR